MASPSQLLPPIYTFVNGTPTCILQIIAPEPIIYNATATMSKGPNANADFQNQYNAFKESLQQLSRKIGEIEGESEEHK
jgi:hypothetical protein